MRTVGFAGTAKNTGKTTTTLAVLEQARAARIPVALTSIGFDGENQDQVTGLPKPRFLLEKGEFVATAEDCLRNSTAALRIVDRTGIHTALGEILIGEVQQPGAVLLAGPNRSSDLRLLIKKLETMGIRLTLVDGALNRLVPLICTDGLVFATGAALDPRIGRILEHAQALHRLLKPEKCEGDYSSDCIQVLRKDGPLIKIFPGSLLGDAVQSQLETTIRIPLQRLVIPGACNPARLEALVSGGAPFLEGSTFVFGSPLKLIASGSPLVWVRLFQQFEALSIQIAFLETIPCFFQTVNPFYPHYLSRTGEYKPAYINKDELLASFQNQLKDVITLDIQQPPMADLLFLLSVEHQGVPNVS